MAIPSRSGFSLQLPQMNSISISLSSKFPPKFSRPILVFLRALSSSSRRAVKARATTLKEYRKKLKDDWLASLSCPPPIFAADYGDSGADWVIGIDPDLKGAVALLKGTSSHCSAQVFDAPVLPVTVGKSVRNRLDTKSLVELFRSFDAPIGTTVYIEEARPVPQDGKLGWFCGGFGYGQWIGMLVALGFSVVPVSSALWKKKFELFGTSFKKEDSRRVALELFPSLSLQLKRKKDHGRAEALLIAAYGQSLSVESDAKIALDKSIP